MPKNVITLPIPFNVLSPIVECILSENGAYSLLNIVSEHSADRLIFHFFPKPLLNFLVPDMDQILIFTIEVHHLAEDITQVRIVVPRKKWSRVLTPQIEPDAKKALRRVIKGNADFLLTSFAVELTRNPVYQSYMHNKQFILPTPPPKPAGRMADQAWDDWFRYYYDMKDHGQKITTQNLADMMGRHPDRVRHKKTEYDAQYQDLPPYAS